jgi:hypothetical protein
MTADPLFMEPEVALEKWAIVRHPDGSLHIAGLRDGGERLSRLRMSTPIVSFDRDALTAETSSGRVYRLAENGHSPMLGLILARAFFDPLSAAETVEVSPEDVELALTEPSSGLRH